MTEIQAAVGHSQLKKIPSWMKIRRENWHYLNNRVKAIDGLIGTEISATQQHAGYRFYFSIDLPRLKHDWSRSRIISRLRTLQVPAQQGNTGNLFREQVFKGLIHDLSEFEVCEKLSVTSLYVPCHHNVTKNNLNYMIESLEEVMSEARR